MKIVIRDDEKGLKRAYQVPDSFNENVDDITIGIPLERPTLSQVNWGDVREQVINALVDANIYSLNDLRNTAKHRILSARLGSILLDVITKHFVELN